MERLKRIKGHVPNDLDAGQEPQCNTEFSWVLPEHNGPNGRRCVGSGTLVYNTRLTSDSPFGQSAPCNFCNKTFST